MKAAEATGANTVSASITPLAETKAAARHPKSIATKKSSVNNIAASRSRSASVMPTGSADPETEEKEDDEREDAVDDKLYCVCKTKYDEDRFMIACDRFVISPQQPHWATNIIFLVVTSGIIQHA